MMQSQYVKKLKLPEKPGVYIFGTAEKKPIYIGRATSLRDRVRSYFANDIISTRGPRIVDMVTRAKTLRYIETDSVLEAIILESNLIKKYQPKYNVDERDDKSSYYVVITDEVWPRVFTVRARDLEKAKETKSKIHYKFIFGPYVHSGLIIESLKILRKIFPFKDKKAIDPRHEYFYQTLGRSPDGNDKKAHAKYMNTIKNLALFFEGKKDRIYKNLERQMNAHAKKMEFEQAQEIKHTLYALRHINDMALIKRAESDKRLNRPLTQDSRVDSGTGGQSRDKSTRLPFRIEAYDIAHLAGTNVVGAMVVATDVESRGNIINTPDEYRLFKISREQNNDVANLVEILMRRLNHSEWQYPDLMVVDGGENHLKSARAVLASRRISIPVLAVTKDVHHKAKQIIGNDDLAKKYNREIIALNAEAHRFVLKYHRKKRNVI